MISPLMTEQSDVTDPNRATAARGDPSTDEFAEFVTSRTPYLLRAAFLLTGDQQLAEDLVQDVLARTYRAWRRLDRAGNASAYTRKVMYHLQVSWWRRRRVSEVLTEVDPHRAGESRDVDLQLIVRAALLRLTVAQRAALVLRFFEDLSEAQAAEVLGCSKSTVHSRTERGLKRLAVLIPELKGDVT